MGFAEHRGVVVGIARGHDLEVELLEALDRLALLVGHAQVVVHQDALGVGLEAVAEQRRQAELLHQRLGELVEGVGEDHHLVGVAQRVEEFARALHRPHAGDDLLDVGQAELLLRQDVQAVLHQGVVVGLVAGGAAQLGDAGTLGEFDPDFGDEHTFEVETDDTHR